MKMVKQLLELSETQPVWLAEQCCFLQAEHASLHKDMEVEWTLAISCQGWEWDLRLVWITWSKISKDLEINPSFDDSGFCTIKFCHLSCSQWPRKSCQGTVVVGTNLCDSSTQHEIHLTKDKHCLTCHLPLKTGVEKPTLSEGSSSCWKPEV